MTHPAGSATEVLRALGAGWALRSHRSLDGAKCYRLHPPPGEGVAQDVPWELVVALREQRLVDSNKKFPSATYLLTDKGQRLLEKLGGAQQPPARGPLAARGWE